MDHSNFTSPASTISQMGELKCVLQPIWASVLSSIKWGETGLSDFFFKRRGRFRLLFFMVLGEHFAQKQKPAC